MGTYSTRRGRPLGCSEQAMHGVATNMNLFALDGESEMVTVFDDFNHVMQSMAFGEADGFEECGWVLTDVGTPANDFVHMNDPAVATDFYSCIHIYPSDVADEGGNMQLDHLNSDTESTADQLTTLSGRYNFPHMWIPSSTMGATSLDNSTWFFACRFGLLSSDTTTGTFDGKGFIGWTEAGNTGVMTAATGAIATGAGAGPVFGVHFDGDTADEIRLVSQRDETAAWVSGTNYQTLLSGTDFTGVINTWSSYASEIRWFDFAMRMWITDMSDDDANGWTISAFREVTEQTSPVGNQLINYPGEGYKGYYRNLLTNQTPNQDTIMVPTIEFINGPTYISQLKIDWWAFGCSRYSYKT